MKYFQITVLTLLPACGASIGPTYVQTTAAQSVPVRSINALTPVSEVPDVGEARYSGDLGFGPGQVQTTAEARIVGDMVLDVDFDRNVIDGRADHFVDQLTGEHMNGAVGIDMRVYRDADETASDGVAGFADGTLSRPNGTDVTVRLDAFGDFYGTAGRRVAGTVEGQVDGLALTPSEAVTGIFDVRR